MPIKKETLRDLKAAIEERGKLIAGVKRFTAQERQDRERLRLLREAEVPEMATRAHLGEVDVAEVESLQR